MKRHIAAWLLLSMLTVSVCACGNGSTAPNTEPEQETEAAESAPVEEAPAFSFSDLRYQEFWFSSGAGAWATTLTIDENGSFSGEYHDSDMGDSAAEYPNGTVYQCSFSGQFTQPEPVNDYTWSMEIEEITFAQTPDAEEILDGIRYIYTEAYGLDGAEKILIYLPGAPLSELPEEFRSWIGYYDLNNTEDTELPFYALNNEPIQYGFMGYDIMENLQSDIASAESWAAQVEDDMENDSTLSQADLNAKSQELYEIWDSALNNVWRVLQQALDEDAMEALTVVSSNL